MKSSGLSQEDVQKIQKLGNSIGQQANPGVPGKLTLQWSVLCSCVCTFINLLCPTAASL